MGYLGTSVVYFCVSFAPSPAAEYPERFLISSTLQYYLACIRPLAFAAIFLPDPSGLSTRRRGIVLVDDMTYRTIAVNVASKQLLVE